MAYLESRAGPDAVHTVLAAMPAAARAAIEAAAPTDEIAYAALVELWEAVDTRIRDAHPAWAEEAGAMSINSLGVQMYGGILRKSTPHAFLTQSVSLFRLFYHPGDMEVVDDATTHAVLRLVGFDPRTRLFCRRQTGGLRRALEIAGGAAPRVRHVRCSLEGDAFCEWDLAWQLDDVKPQSS